MTPTIRQKSYTRNCRHFLKSPIQSSIACLLLSLLAILTNPATAAAQGKIVVWSSLIAPDKFTNAADITGAEDFWTGHYAVALKKDGTMSAWGSSANPAKTKLPAGLSDVVAVAGGRNFCLALKGDGSVAGWGGEDGQEAAQIPPGLSQVKAIAAGSYHALALRQDGTVSAWGNNSSGQCSVPPGLDDVVAIAAGQNSSGAVKSDGSVLCWGRALDAQNPINLPAGLAGVSALTAGDGNFLAIKSDGSGAGWGTNYAGQLPTIPFPDFPFWDKDLDSVDIKRLKRSKLAGVSSGINESIAWMTTGKVLGANVYHPIDPRPAAKARVIGAQFYTFNRNGRLFAGGPNIKQLLLNGRTGARLISAGHWHSAAVFKNDMVRVSGERRYFQGRAKRTAGKVPKLVKVVSGLNFDVGLFENGTVAVEGFNDEETTPPSGLSGVIDIDAGNNHAIALRSDGTVVTWGLTTHIQKRLTVPQELQNPNTANIKAIAATSFFCIALQEGGKLFVWGGANWEDPLDVPANLPSDLIALAGGERHFLALRANGEVLGYGDSGAGQIAIPKGLSGVTSIAAGGKNSLALKQDGTVVVWGAENTVPSGLSNVTAIAAGPYHCMALVGNASSKSPK